MDCPQDFPGKNTEVWLPFPSPGDLPNPAIKAMSPALAGVFLFVCFTTEPPGKPAKCSTCNLILKIDRIAPIFQRRKLRNGKASYLAKSTELLIRGIQI